MYLIKFSNCIHRNPADWAGHDEGQSRHGREFGLRVMYRTKTGMDRCSMFSMVIIIKASSRTVVHGKQIVWVSLISAVISNQ